MLASVITDELRLRACTYNIHTSPPTPSPFGSLLTFVVDFDRKACGKVGEDGGGAFSTKSSKKPLRMPNNLPE